MTKTILITGATDGIGLITAQKLLASGHKVLIHGRNQQKLMAVADTLSEWRENIEIYTADLSSLTEAKMLAAELLANHDRLDVLINNAGVYKTEQTRTADNLDVRFAVNTAAPYLLTTLLMPVFSPSSRVINLSSAAQRPVSIAGLLGDQTYTDSMAAYAQSKLAITIWSQQLARKLAANGPVFIAINPGSLLASKMVKEGFGVAGNDINIGADILCRAALSDEFGDANGKYYDNDSHRFADPHPDALNDDTATLVMDALDRLTEQYR